MTRAGAIAAILLLLIGCQSTTNREEVADDPYWAPIVPEHDPQSLARTGSLFNTQYSNDLYADKKALRVGDIITVELKESTQASKSAKTETKKQSDVRVNPITGLAGAAVNIGNQSIELGMGSNSALKGDAKSNQSNSLFGKITVNVMRVLPNGNLLIRGEKWLTLNTGEEFIRLEGLVRGQDVSADNTVESSRIANARIRYSGKGDLQETQSAGWLTRFFTSTLMPF